MQIYYIPLNKDFSKGETKLNSILFRRSKSRYSFPFKITFPAIEILTFNTYHRLTFDVMFLDVLILLKVMPNH